MRGLAANSQPFSGESGGGGDIRNEKAISDSGRQMTHGRTDLETLVLQVASISSPITLNIKD